MDFDKASIFVDVPETPPKRETKLPGNLDGSSAQQKKFAPLPVVLKTATKQEPNHSNNPAGFSALHQNPAPLPAQSPKSLNATRNSDNLVAAVAIPPAVKPGTKAALHQTHLETPSLRGKNGNSEAAKLGLAGQLASEARGQNQNPIPVKTVSEVESNQPGVLVSDPFKTGDKPALLKPPVVLQTLASNKSADQSGLPASANQRHQTKAEKWIVLDGGSHPCHDVTVYTEGQSDWRVILVNNGDVKVKGCQNEQCQLLQTSDINQAYLKAISQGADVIVLADCLARYPRLDFDFRVNDLHQYGMYYNATNMFNPYQFAGYEAVFPKVNSAWDRPINDSSDVGSPLIPPEPNAEMHYISDFGRVSFRQGFRLGEDTCVCEDASSFSPDGEEVLDNPVVSGPNTLVSLATGPSCALPDAFYWLYSPPGLSTHALEYFRTLWLHALKRAGYIHIGNFRQTRF
ncbi:hypothetical protein EGW08_022983 [Elysia chlorotica]|uniref:Uncharacterized protein n=1 Tax=Elysia chlorotica TaxID=188477 RepID=A0A433SJL5_ELYCH|nr:hypothetical protein EGW08_022983 [Elysia chlorotica]